MENKYSNIGTGYGEDFQDGRGGGGGFGGEDDGAQYKLEIGQGKSQVLKIGKDGSVIKGPLVANRVMVKNKF